MFDYFITIEVIPIRFAVKIFRLKVYMTIASPFIQVRLKLDYFK